MEYQASYLRLSLTDRCNFRCFYCMPEAGIQYIRRNEVLSFEEIAKIVHIFAALGIKHLRITGGEPLVRKDLDRLVEILAGIDDIEDISLTTNGSLLPIYAEGLKGAGLKRVNISLDSLKQDKFRSITKTNAFYQVMEGIDKAIEVGFQPVKLNVVVMGGINDDEINDFVDFALARGLILRFIEFMRITPLWRSDYFIPIEEVKRICEKRFKLREAGDNGFGPARYFEVERGGGRLGFIKTDEENCKRCCRLRLTCTGELKICLFENRGLALKHFLSEGVDDEQIMKIIKAKVLMKPDVTYKKWETSKIYISQIGG